MVASLARRRCRDARERSLRAGRGGERPGVRAAARRVRRRLRQRRLRHRASRPRVDRGGRASAPRGRRQADGARARDARRRHGQPANAGGRHRRRVEDLDQGRRARPSARPRRRALGRRCDGLHLLPRARREHRDLAGRGGPGRDRAPPARRRRRTARRPPPPASTPWSPNAWPPTRRRRSSRGSAIPDGWMVVDAGPETVARIAADCAGAGTIIWNGPLGIYEIPAFAAGHPRRRARGRRLARRRR